MILARRPTLTPSRPNAQNQSLMAIQFTDAIDIRLDLYRDLKGQSTLLAKQNHFIVEGKYCVKRLAESKLRVHSVVIQQGRQDEIAGWFSDPSNHEEIEIYVLSAAEIRKLVGFDFHRGVIACGIGQPAKPVSVLLAMVPKPPIVLASLGISDRENLGSIIRTATAMGVQHLICDRASVDPLARRVIRTSMATVFSQVLYSLDTAKQDFESLAGEGGFRTIATTLAKDATPIDDFQWDHRPVVLMMGNESSGLSNDLQAAATDRVTIPTAVAADSLNVSVATAIFLYELTRRARSAEK